MSTPKPNRLVEVAGWPRPRGYVNGVVTSRPTLYVAGQIGWNVRGEFEHDDLAGQFAQALDNVLEVVRAAGGTPESLVKMTVYVTDVSAYRLAAPGLSPIWRARFGRHYPAMALVGVAALVEPRAVVEIEAIATLDEEPT